MGRAIRRLGLLLIAALLIAAAQPARVENNFVYEILRGR